MKQAAKLVYLRIALIVFGAFFILGAPAMMIWIWPSGWGWTPPQAEYEQMLMVV